MNEKIPISSRSLMQFYQWHDKNRRCGKSSTHACSRCHTLPLISVGKPFLKNKKDVPLEAVV